MESGISVSKKGAHRKKFLTAYETGQQAVLGDTPKTN
jgi:hypothetical protein